MTKLYATAARGTADLVAGELRALGFASPRWDTGGVRFTVPEGGELEAGMRACLHLRVAMRVLWPLANLKVTDEESLYQQALAVPWEDHLDLHSTFAVNATSSAPPPLAHTPFLGMRVKDAIADRLTSRLGARPNVDRDDPDVQIFVHLDADGAGSVGLDLGGESLHTRGTRVAQTAAPLRETLAAAIVLLSGWEGGCPLIDPMCGSGTLAIEAGLIARRIAPGLATGSPRRFGFTRWPRFREAEKAIWQRLVDEARAAERPLPFPILASDREPDAVAATRRNATAANVALYASIADVRDLAPSSPPGVVISNPPYGERLGEGPGLLAFWRGLGITLRRLDGHTAFFLIPSNDALRALGLRPTWERKLMNGPIPIRLCRFELGQRAGAKPSYRSAQQRKPVE